ncbi:MAG: hypothetical protein BWK80_42990 [Desulfobacteraceae bacterium IS3]|nr:MAG: hypothetical protein BWK80_42990 [Desulfobacteraceae bacterium IS3]
MDNLPDFDIQPCKQYYIKLKTVTIQSNGNKIESYFTDVFTTKTLCIPIDERKALLDFYDDGSDHNPGAECGWTGVACDKIGSAGVLNHVSKIELLSKNLTGNISLSSIAVFKDYLTTLNLNENNLTGSIPEAIGDFTKLQYLSLKGNGLTGDIPSKLWTLSALKEIDLSGNGLTGKLPEGLKLSNLQKLNLSDNDIDCSIPAWNSGNFPALLDLRLSNNKLEGALPSSIWSLPLIPLTHLYVNGNMLCGEVDSGITGCSNLEEIDFRWNALYSTNDAVDSFLNSKQIETSNWEATQTLAPQNFRVPVPASQTWIALAWKEVAFGDGYEIQYSKNSDRDYLPVPAIIIDGRIWTDYTLKELLPGTTYYIRIRSFTNGHADKVYSEWAKVGINQLFWLEAKTDTAPPPQIGTDGVSPKNGPASIAGKAVTITGANFLKDATVTFDGKSSTTTPIVSSDGMKITCTAPAYKDVNISDPVCVPVTVINPDDDKKSTTWNCYTYDPRPFVSSVVPNHGDQKSGTQVVISGDNFDADKTYLTVKFGDLTVPSNNLISSGKTSIICITPSYFSPVQVDVTVTNKDGQWGMDDKAYKYDTSIPVPTIDKLSDNYGPSTGGENITITGTNFQTGVKVGFGGTDALNVFLSGTQIITCNTPPHTPGTVNVRVTNPDGQLAENTDGYTFAQPPMPKYISPNNGLESTATDVTITGDYFDAGAKVKFGNADAGNVIFVSSSSITCKTPEISASEAGQDGQVDVTVINSDGQHGVLERVYQFKPAIPIITGIDPNQGPTCGGTIVTIGGVQFVKGATVTFGGQTSPSCSFVSEKEISCESPKYETETSVDVKVTNPNGKPSVLSKCYAYKNCTFEINPKQGPVSGGTKVTIKRKDESVNFIKGATATFGESTPVKTEFVSNEEITCIVPERKIDGEYTAGYADVKIKNPDQPVMLCQNAYNYMGILSSEREALLEFYNKTGGENWKDKLGWLGSVGTECDWKGITCDNGNNHVTKIVLDDNRLEGTVPESIGNLTSLEVISLRSNRLTGDIPITLRYTKLAETRTDHLSDFSANQCLSAKNDDDLLFFNRKQVYLDEKQTDSDWKKTQICYRPIQRIKVDPANTMLNEGEEKTFTIKLDNTAPDYKEPTAAAEIKIGLSTTNIRECSISHDTVTLKKENWTTGISVTVTAENDGIVDGTQSCTVLTSQTTCTEDGNYDKLDPEDVTVIVYDNPGLKIYSVSPSLGVTGSPLPVKVIGTGFEKGATTVSMYKDGTDSEISVSPVTVTDGTSMSLTLPAQSVVGQYTQYTLKVTVGDKTDILVGAVSFGDATEVSRQKRRKAIIVAGGGPYYGNSLWNATMRCTQKAYNSLISQGYKEDSIYYLSMIAIDADGDKISDVDEYADRENLEYAIKTWALQGEYPADELLIYMTDHGGDKYFTLNSSANSKEDLSVRELRGWLDEFQKNTNRKVIVIYDACKSGSFLSELRPSESSVKDRYVIASASENESAWFLDEGEFSFSSHFWNDVSRNGKLYHAFIYAKEMMWIDQNSVIDINSDGSKDILSLNANGTVTGDFTIGRGRAAGSDSPEIGICNSELEKKTLMVGEGVKLCAEVISKKHNISIMQAKIIPPPDETKDPVTVLDTVKLSPNEEKTEFIKEGYKFAKPGSYKASIYAVDEEGYYSMSKLVSFTVVFSLRDAVNALRVVAGLEVQNLPPKMVSNQTIGLGDAIFILRKIVELDD